MRAIYKYRLDDVTELMLPPDAKVIKADAQNGQPCVWVLFDPAQAETIKRTFIIAGTGHEVPDSMQYIDSWQAPPFVWHLFELI